MRGATDRGHTESIVAPVMGAGAHVPAMIDVDTESTQIRRTSGPGRRTNR